VRLLFEYAELQYGRWLDRRGERNSVVNRLYVGEFKLFLTTDEVAQILKVTPQTVRDLCRAGDFDFVRVKSRMRIYQRSFDAWLSKQQHTDEPPDEQLKHINV
jgi:excisionase family DNA binding protein